MLSSCLKLKPLPSLKLFNKSITTSKPKGGSGQVHHVFPIIDRKAIVINKYFKQLLFSVHIPYGRENFYIERFLCKICQTPNLYKIKVCHPQNSTNIMLASCTMSMSTMLVFSGNYKNDLTMTAKITKFQSFPIFNVFMHLSTFR